jgi:hypothetical protein
MGEPANLEYFPLSQTLVINQTPDEQIQDLLSALRRLQDQDVAIEASNQRGKKCGPLHCKKTPPKITTLMPTRITGPHAFSSATRS